MNRVAFAFLLLLIACGPSAKIREGDQYLKQNKLDAALLSYQQAYLDSPDNAAARAALGRMLTLRRISFYSGIDLMKSAYDQKPTAELRRELVLLHMEAGDLPRAQVLLDPDHLSLTEYMTDAAALERAAMNCLRKQNEDGFNILKHRPVDPENAREAFLIRCLLSPGWRRTKLEDAKAIFLTAESARTRCELTALFPEVSNLTLDYCKHAFPGSIAIYREPVRGIELVEGKTTKLFEDELFIPGEPPPQPKEETSGPFVPDANPATPGTPIPLPQGTP